LLTRFLAAAATGIIARVDWHTLARGVLAGRAEIFERDYIAHQFQLREELRGRTVCVIGAGGSIGRATAEALLEYGPRRTLLIDISENNLAEVTRRLRNRFGQSAPDFEAWALDYTREPFFALLDREQPEVVLNFAAYKHVRSEKDHLTLAEMIRVNVLGNMSLLAWAQAHPLRRFFVISTDKAASPASCMGATKRLMEQLLFATGAAEPRAAQAITSTRFANVLFSDGSLPASFIQRLEQRQPLAGPAQLQRYFITPLEAARLCLLAACHPASGEFLVPRLRPSDMLTFPEIAQRFLRLHGFSSKHYTDPQTAQANLETDAAQGAWPCVFLPPRTSGEKPFEEFVEPGEQLSSTQPYAEIDAVVGGAGMDLTDLQHHCDTFRAWSADRAWLQTHTKADVVAWLECFVPSFRHIETQYSLDRVI
jgi:FlaA1/EpsC-like NDP-sugar epimerase